MATPEFYPTPSPEAIATYNYTDIAEGTGIVKFYGFMDTDDSGDNYKMQEELVYSSNSDVSDLNIAIEETEFLGNNQPLTKVYDKDFDLGAFNFPKTLKGTAFFQCGIRASTSGTGTGYVVVRLRKWDGTTETEVASVQSHDITGPITVEQILGLHFAVPRTHYKKGDILRMTVELWIVTPSANTFSMTVGHDPMNRDGTFLAPSTDDIITQMTIHVPFAVLD